MFWWKNQLLGGVALDSKALSSRVYQLAILCPPASLAGSLNSAQIAVISIRLSSSVDLPVSYPEPLDPSRANQNSAQITSIDT